MDAIRNFFAGRRLRIAALALLVITVALAAVWFFALRNVADDTTTAATQPDNGSVTVIYDDDGNIVSVGNVPEVDPAAALRALGIPQTCDDAIVRLDEIIAKGEPARTAAPDDVYAFNMIHYVSTELCSYRRLQDWDSINMAGWVGDTETTKSSEEPTDQGTSPGTGPGTGTGTGPVTEQGTSNDTGDNSVGDQPSTTLELDLDAVPEPLTGDATPPTDD